MTGHDQNDDRAAYTQIANDLAQRYARLYP